MLNVCVYNDRAKFVNFLLVANALEKCQLFIFEFYNCNWGDSNNSYHISHQKIWHEGNNSMRNKYGLLACFVFGGVFTIASIVNPVNFILLRNLTFSQASMPLW